MPAFGGYVVLTTSTTAQNKTDINANLTRLKNLFQPASASAGAPVSPDFDNLPPSAAQQVRDEVDAIIAVITASP